ncbi:sodium:solute symporter family transporter [Methyloligella solikamskensis]|uniref:Cation/acetate symporter ActP n=1 Tax=Methyloligella solikamskensis TaxID=1177756 RepID=A0ABW3JD59_9HYPH
MRPALRLRTPNPHLGAYFGITASAFISLSILLALLEQVGWREATLGPALIVLPVIFYLAVAARTRTMETEDYFASGRRVPSVYNGFMLAATTIGGIGYFAYTGTAFFLGVDAFAIGIGLTFGMLLFTVLFSPYLRKAGAFTVPSFLGFRFGSKILRVASAAALIIPVVFLLAAEIKIAGLVASMFVPIPYSIAVLFVAAIVCGVVILGGMRALTWTGGAQFIVGAIAFAVPLVIVSVLVTVLPAPQLTYGSTLNALETSEINAGFKPGPAEGLAEALPGNTAEAVPKPFLEAFGALSPPAFVMLFLCVAMGAACLPSLLMRTGSSLTVSGQRWAGAWAVLFVAVFAISVPPLAVFAKALMFQDLAQLRPDLLPEWMTALIDKQLMFARDMNASGGLQANEVLLSRDGILLAFPIAAKLPIVCTVIVAAGGIAMAFAAAGSHLYSLGASVSEDIYRLFDREAAALFDLDVPRLPRHTAVWAVSGIFALGTAIYLAIGDIDLMRAALSAFALLAATFFPVLLLSIWWRRYTELGALASLSVGGIIMLVELLVRGFFSSIDLSTGTMAISVLATLLAIGAGVGVSLWDREPSPATTAYFDGLRDPEGEALYDAARHRAAAAAAAAAH